MAFLSLVTGVVDSVGERVDLPQADGTYLPIRLKLGLNLSGTPATNGGQTDITVDAATVSATYAQVQAALATADADLAVGNFFGVAADHFSAGNDPALSGALRTSGGELVTYRDSGVDYAALQGSGTLVTVGNSSSDAEVLVGTGKKFSVVVNGTGTQLEVGSTIKLFTGTTTHATATGEVGLDATGHLTVWTGGAESSLVAQSDTLSGDLAGSLGGTPEVVGLRGVGIDATPPASGQVLAYDGSNWKATTAAAGGGAALYPALDSHDLGYWDFSAASGSFANGGTAGVVDLAPGGTGLAYGHASPLGACCYEPATASLESTATSAIQPTSAATIALLLKPQFYASLTTLYGVFGIADPTAASFPFAIYTNTNTTPASGFGPTGVWNVSLKTTVSGFQTLTLDDGSGNPDFKGIDWNQWNLLVATYDGSALKAYINGSLVGTLAMTGTIDYATVGSPAIIAGSSASKATWKTLARLGYLRIRDTALSAADVRLAWRHAMAFA